MVLIEAWPSSFCRVESDEQLTDYQLGVETVLGLPVEQVMFIVFCWGYATRRIRFLAAPKRDEAEIQRFRYGAIEIDRLIRTGVFVAMTGPAMSSVAVSFGRSASRRSSISSGSS